MKQKNTIQKGSVRVIIYQENKTWFGAVLEFNIVETGDNPLSVMAAVDEAIRAYVVAAKKSKLHGFPHALNQTPDKEHSDLWNRLEGRKKIPSPISSVYMHAEVTI